MLIRSCPGAQMRARNARRLTRGRLAGLGKALSGNSIIETVSLIESPFFRLPDDAARDF